MKRVRRPMIEGKRMLDSCSKFVLGFVVAILVALTSSGIGQAPAKAGVADIGPSGGDEVRGKLAPEDSFSGTPDPNAVVQVGHARFTVLTPQLIRMEWSPDGVFEDRPSMVFVNRRLPVPEFRTSRKGGELTLETDALRLHYAAGGDGKFSAANLTIQLTKFGAAGSAPTVWSPGTPDSGNLQGTTDTLDGAKGGDVKHPIGPGLISRDGWAVVDDSERPLFDSDDFTFRTGEDSSWPWVVARSKAERQDWYFFGYGHEYRTALADYVKVAGRIPLPPRFAFGAWWSRYWAYSDKEVEEIARGFRENDTPLDVFVIDMDWHKSFEGSKELDPSGHKLGWSGYSWNRLLFPDAGDFLSKLHREGFKTTLNLHPASGVQPWEDRYAVMAKAMGQNPDDKKYVPFDITNKNFAQNYMDILHHPLEKQGIDFWWLDWQQEPTTPIAGLNPTWWLNYVHFTDQEREGKRPLLFHRWGGLGNHRYEIGFSGDTISVWDSLAFQPWFTATAANVGYAYWSHDIGGHWPGPVDPELYTRWVQFGAFSPILRTHTTKNPDSERRIWAYPEPYSDIMRSTYQLRYALEPYIYTEARRTYDTGLAFLHPLYYDYPDSAEAYTNKNEYAFGEAMIVSPVVKPVDASTKLAKETVWLPSGEWIEWSSGKHLTGPANLERSFAIDEEPVYLKAGAIVPMQPPMQYTGQRPVDPLILNIWPQDSGQSSAYTIYEDGCDSEAYKRGEFSQTAITATQNSDTSNVQIAVVEGRFPGMPTTRSYELRLPADWPPTSVSVDGQPLTVVAADSEGAGWHYEGDTLTTIVRIERRSVMQPVHIELRRAPNSGSARTELDGFPGSVRRLRSAYDILNAQWPYAVSPDAVVDALQTGDRMSYYPQTATQELSQFAGKYSVAQASIQKLLDSVATLSDEQLTAQLMIGHGAETTVERAKNYRKSLEQAISQLKDGRPE